MGSLLLALLVAAATSGAAAPRSVLRAQYAYAWGHKIDCAKLKEELVASHTTSHSFLLEDSDGSSYLSFVECLNQTTGFAVDGVPFTAWVTLIPPAEGALGSALISAEEAVLCGAVQHLGEVCAQYAQGVHHLEAMLRRQLVAALGKEVTPADFDKYMIYHDQRRYRPEFAPEPFCFAVRRGVKPTRATFSTFTPACWNVRPS